MDNNLHVTTNLHSALLHLTPEAEPLTLWIDALCIKQLDEIKDGANRTNGGDLTERNLHILTTVKCSIFLRSGKSRAFLNLLPIEQGVLLFLNESKREGKKLVPHTTRKYGEIEIVENTRSENGASMQSLESNDKHQLEGDLNAVAAKVYFDRKVWALQILTSRLNSRFQRYSSDIDTQRSRPLISSEQTLRGHFKLEHSGTPSTMADAISLTASIITLIQTAYAVQEVVRRTVAVHRRAPEEITALQVSVEFQIDI
jgi:hypothetical protein